MPRVASTSPPISNRALNRATLARQGLLERQAAGPVEMLRHLIGLQGQVPNAPYVALWSRLARFRPADLEALLVEREAVRATLMRATVHVALAEDFFAIRPLIQPIVARVLRSNHLKPLKGADPEEVAAAGRQELDAEALVPAELGRRLQARWPDIGAIDLSMPVRLLEPLVHVPPAGLFGRAGAPALTTARRWLGEKDVAPIDPEALALRYLKAFGPASGADFNAWSGLGGGAALFERLRPRLVTFATEDGREVFDLPEAPRPDEATPAPVRLLPDYDNVILGYAERGRILSPEAWKGLWRSNGLRPAFLIDGVVRGNWKLTLGKGTARADLFWFDSLSRGEAAALRHETERLLADLAPGRDVAVTLGAFAE
jgi:hypothetical protein